MAFAPRTVFQEHVSTDVRSLASRNPAEPPSQSQSLIDRTASPAAIPFDMDGAPAMTPPGRGLPAGIRRRRPTGPATGFCARSCTAPSARPPELPPPPSLATPAWSTSTAPPAATRLPRASVLARRRHGFWTWSRARPGAAPPSTLARTNRGGCPVRDAAAGHRRPHEQPQTQHGLKRRGFEYPAVYTTIGRAAIASRRRSTRTSTTAGALCGRRHRVEGLADSPRRDAESRQAFAFLTGGTNLGTAVALFQFRGPHLHRAGRPADPAQPQMPLRWTG